MFVDCLVKEESILQRLSFYTFDIRNNEVTLRLYNGTKRKGIHR